MTMTTLAQLKGKGILDLGKLGSIHYYAVSGNEVVTATAGEPELNVHANRLNFSVRIEWTNKPPAYPTDKHGWHEHNAWISKRDERDFKKQDPSRGTRELIVEAIRTALTVTITPETLRLGEVDNIKRQIAHLDEDMDKLAQQLDEMQAKRRALCRQLD